MITRKQLIKKYIDFFKSKNHAEIPSASLVPENDPTVLFTTAGMHPLIPYLLGQTHPLGKRLVDVQKCIRTQDIDEVGDSTHHTFFEMLGNWSLGDYWKQEAIKMTFEFLTKSLNVPVQRLAATCFEGNENAPKDNESAEVWKLLGIPEKRIAFLPAEENFWGPAGKTGPCGPNTEIFYWKPNNIPASGQFDTTDNNWVEIGNDVLMEYDKIEIETILIDAVHCLIDKEKGINKELAKMLNKSEKRIIVITNAPKEKIEKDLGNCSFEIFTLNKNPLKKYPNYFKQLIQEKKIDLNKTIYFDHSEENILSAKENKINSILYKDNNQIKKLIEDNFFIYNFLYQKNIDFGGGLERTLAVLNGYADNYLTEIWQPIIAEIEKISKKKYSENKKAMRIIADHIKAAAFILADGITPGNAGQEYILRRLIRRAIRFAKELEIKNFTKIVAEPIFNIYDDYSELAQNKNKILEELSKEEEKFNLTLEKGIKVFEKISFDQDKISGKDSFLLYQSYGFPIEMTKELAKEKGIGINEAEFNQEFENHQRLSQTASAGMFKSGLADDSTATTKLHTATHLLLASLKQVLNDDNIIQRGSNINPQRLRFDFSFPRKLIPEEIKQIEDLVNSQIANSLEITRTEMSPGEAKAQGATGTFGAKYPDIVSVYKIGNFSKEICTGPHVNNTSELVSFKILKEGSSSAGVRRIKAVLK